MNPIALRDNELMYSLQLESLALASNPATLGASPESVTLHLQETEARSSLPQPYPRFGQGLRPP
jgi:hypothetical protein